MLRTSHAECDTGHTTIHLPKGTKVRKVEIRDYSRPDMPWLVYDGLSEARRYGCLKFTESDESLTVILTEPHQMNLYCD